MSSSVARSTIVGMMPSSKTSSGFGDFDGGDGGEVDEVGEAGAEAFGGGGDEGAAAGADAYFDESAGFEDAEGFRGR